MRTAEEQYRALCSRILNEGVWVYNERTGKNCLTIINADLEYDVGAGEFPILTSKKTFWKKAVAEMCGYVVGADNAADFRRIGTTTWDANANETQAWLDNPFRKGEDDMGIVYGVIGRAMRDVKLFDRTNFDQAQFLNKAGYTLSGISHTVGGSKQEVWTRTIDQLRKVYENLKAGKDDRFEMISFHDPAEMEFGCLRSCMYSHHFSILDGTLYLNSTQRSVDTPLGLPFNMIQCYFLLAIMAQITGLKPGKVFHKLVNVHFYEDQIPGIEEMLSREPLKPTAELIIADDLYTLEDLEGASIDDFEVVGYESHPYIKFPFSA